MPTYPGLERWQLLDKMGDGAFSNVYRARDTTGQFGEAAIKVVRKFEMNSKQVCCAFIPFYRLVLLYLLLSCCPGGCLHQLPLGSSTISWGHRMMKFFSPSNEIR